jgi:ABC-type lipoprotein release transport system permease subunit
MTVLRYVFQCVRHYWKGHLGLCFGAFLAAAVLSGSLLVGDSVRASLRRVAEARLGKVAVGLVGGDRWFTAALAEAVGAAPVILADGAVSAAAGGVRVNAVQVLGVEERFWKLSPSGEVLALERGQMAINEALAKKTGAKLGDTLIVRLERPSAISRDAPLSGSTNEEVSLRRQVARIVTADQFGAFQLAASQTQPDSVFLGLEDLQVQVEMEGKVNALLTADAGSEGLAERLEAVKTLEDFALKLDRVEGDAKEWQVATDRVFLDEVLAADVFKRAGSYGVLTYLVNGITSAKGGTPYSMVSAVEETVLAQRLGPVPGGEGAVISQWLAEDQKLAVGDELSVRYFVVGLGRALEETTARFEVAGIVPMDRPVLNRDWTPKFPGVSDVDNCRDWDPGIPMDTQAIRDQDEKYWDDFGGTPKVFIGLKAGQKLWENRFGQLTSIRFPDVGEEEKALRADLVAGLKLEHVGLVPRDFRGLAAAAAKGSVDFGGLFVGLSLFLIVAALVFAALLFVFTLERRAGQMGLLMALGWTPGMVRRTLLLEAGWIAVVGVALGVVAGGGYTRLALKGLSGVWSGAAPGLALVYEPNGLTVFIAAVAALLVVLAVLGWSSRKVFQTPPRELLAGGSQGGGLVMPAGAAGRGKWVIVGSLIAAVGLLGFGSRATTAEAVAGMFFGGGSLLLVAGLAGLKLWMGRGSGVGGGLRSLIQIGMRGVARRPARSLAVMGMMAGGIFLVTAVNAFRLGAGGDGSRRDSGTGGFALIGESSLPVYEALASVAGKEAFGLDEALLEGVGVVPFRVLEGDDASCLNLNRAQRPVLTGVAASALAERQAFVFAAGGEKGWAGLQQAGTEGEGQVIPAIADQATAMWGLGKGVGDRLSYQDAQGREFEVELVGLLAGSVLQGKLIISEQAFLAKYPNAPGYRFFLVDAPAEKAAELAAHLTRQLEKRGLALEVAGARLAAFLAVQNTYIGIFTVLGGLGVLLGTAGLGVLVARHVLERRGELSLMQALGFTSRALRGMVLSEHLVLLVAGLVLGAVCAFVAVWPSVQQSGQGLPWRFLGALWVTVLGFGVLVCILAVVGAVRGRLMESIRQE